MTAQIITDEDKAFGVDDLAAMAAEIERLKALLYCADAVVFDLLMRERGIPLKAKESMKTIDTWAVISIDRYVSVNPWIQARWEELYEKVARRLARWRDEN
jgi:hypothetical protein